MNECIFKIVREISHPRDEVVRGEYIEQQSELGRDVVMAVSIREMNQVLYLRHIAALGRDVVTEQP